MDSQRRRPLDQPPPLDPHLVEQVLSGAQAPEDLPPALGPLAGVIGALREDGVQGQAGQKDRAAIDSMVTALSDPSSRLGRRRPWRRFPSAYPLPRRVGGVRVRLATSLVAVVLAFLVGTAYAGVLPGPAQEVASIVLSKVGLNAPGHDANDDGDPSGSEGENQDRHGPDPNGPAQAGLCNAYFHGNGGEQGGKNDSTAFQNLVDAADQAGQSVEDFCGVQDGVPGTPGENHGKGHDKEKSNDHGSDHENNGTHGSNDGEGESGD
jgi:hypothetical protein